MSGAGIAITRRGLIAAAALVPMVASGQTPSDAPRLPPGVPGRLVRHADVRSAHVAPRHVDVWLPPEAEAGKPLALLVMHDGQDLFDPASAYAGHTWGVAEALSTLSAAGKVPPTIVAGVWNTGARWREYMPAQLLGLLPDGVRASMEGEQGGASLSDGYERFLADELLPVLRGAHPIAPGPAAIMGSSMGGLASLEALAEHPAAFARAGCISTHWPFADPRKADRAEPARAAVRTYIARALGAPQGRRLWMDHGDRMLDQYYAPYQANADAALDTARWRRGVDYESRAYPGAEHSEPSWRARLADPLLFLLGQRA